MGSVSGSTGVGQELQQPSLFFGGLPNVNVQATRAIGSNGRQRQRSKPNMAPASDDFGSDGFLPNSGTNRLCQAMTTDTSPDSKSPICLDRFENVAYLNHCYHRFCFRCVQEWSKNKAECPLCKQPFHSIIHSMRSDDDFNKEYIVRPSENGSFASPNGRRFLVFKTYRAGTFVFLRILIPFWLSHYYVKYHLLGDTILETGEVVPPLEIPSSHH